MMAQAHLSVGDNGLRNTCLLSDTRWSVAATWCLPSLASWRFLPGRAFDRVCILWSSQPFLLVCSLAWVDDFPCWFAKECLHVFILPLHLIDGLPEYGILGWKNSIFQIFEGTASLLSDFGTVAGKSEVALISDLLYATPFLSRSF